MNFTHWLVRRFKPWQISSGITLLTILVTPLFSYMGFYFFTDMKNVEYSIILSVVIPLFLVPMFSFFFLRNLTLLDQSEKENSQLIAELKTTLDNVKELKGLIPICAECKNIRDDKGYWHQVEEYVRQHSEAKFSHGICPECAKKVYEALERKKTAHGH